MNREIKFRAWDVSGKKMLKSTEDLSFNESGKEKDSGWCFSAHLEGKIIVMQYTGLKDKNGKEIYEGDVVLVEDTFTETVDVGVGRIPVAQSPDNHLCEVVFKDGAFKFVVTEKGEVWWKGEYHLDHEDAGGEFEVIGNIYENPELLEEENKTSIDF